MDIIVFLALTIWFLLIFMAWAWMMMRLNALKREMQAKISELGRAIALVDGIDAQVAKVTKRSIDNAVEIDGIGRAHRKLSASINSQKNRDDAEEAELTMTRIADYIQKPEAAENELPAAPLPDIDPAYG